MDRNTLIRSFSAQMDSMARIGTMKHSRDQLPKDIPPHAQLCALFAVAHHGSEMVKDIAQQFGMTSSAGTQLVNGLVKAGLLERTGNTGDRRKIRIILTAKGKKILVQAQEHRVKRITESFTPLSTTEIKQLLSIQGKIVEHWKILCQKKSNK